ncbi:MAG: hypothetical protein IPL40_14885 [Proteobacteria bacterium]|nr:hypothetical protein [Pseudomonadota bacterium]
MVSAITSSQRQEGIEISEARAEEVYKIVFEEPPVAFFRLTQAGDEREKHFVESLADSATGVRFDVSRRDLLAVDGAPLSYWLPPDVLHLFRSVPALQPSFADARQGKATGDDPRFTRQRWEIAPTKFRREWVPFAKGGAFSRFYVDTDLVLDWDPRHREALKASGNALPSESLYFRAGLTYPRAAQVFNVRVMAEGCVFADKGPAIFPKNAVDTDFLLGVLNSSMLLYLCKARTSREQMGGRWEVGVVQRLPIPRPVGDMRQRIATPALRTHNAKATWDEGNEISTRFKEPWLATVLQEHPVRPLAEALEAMLAREAAADTEIQAWYAEMDTAVFDAYGLSPEIRETVLKDLGARPPELIWPQMAGKTAEQKRMEHVVRLLSFCVKQILEGDDDGIVPLVTCNNEPPLEERVLAELGKLVGADRAHVFGGTIAPERRKKVPGHKRADSIGDFLANAY